jgi:hypothetical protein
MKTFSILLIMAATLSVTAVGYASESIPCSPLPAGAISGMRNKLANNTYGFCTITACGNDAQGSPLELSNNKCMQPATISWATTKQIVNAGDVIMTVRAQLSRAPSTPVTVGLSTAESTASSTDFQLITPDAVFAAGSVTSSPVQVRILKPTAYQTNKDVSLKFSSVKSGRATLSTSSTIITIVNSLPQSTLPSVMIANATVNEGESTDLPITLSRPLSSIFPVNVKATITSQGTTQVTYVSIPGGKTSASIHIPTTDLAGYQGNRFVNVTLSINGMPLSSSSVLTGVVTIHDTSEAPPTGIPGLEPGAQPQQANGYMIQLQKTQQVNGYEITGGLSTLGK